MPSPYGESDDTPRAPLLRGGTSLDVDLERDSAQELLAKPRATAEQGALRVRLRPDRNIQLLEALVVAWLMGAMVGLRMWVDFTLAVGCTIAVALLTAQHFLEIGTDGVRVAGKFIAYGDIRDVSGTSVRIVFDTGTERVKTPAVIEGRKAIPGLIARIEKRRAAAARAHAPALDALDRRERPVEEWRAALEELALGGKGFRGPALHDDDLQRILDDPGAPLEQRIGAALALRSRGGDEQGRIRVAAETSVERRVRVALEAAAGEEIDERAIERALDKARATEKRRPD